MVSLSFRFQSERGSAATTGWLGDRWTMRHSRNALARSSGVFHQVSLTREEPRTYGLTLLSRLLEFKYFSPPSGFWPGMAGDIYFWRQPGDKSGRVHRLREQPLRGTGGLW